VAARPGDPVDLEQTILTVRRTALDPLLPERVEGEILALDPPPVRVRRPLTVLAG
jgi:hypothetical protein